MEHKVGRIPTNLSFRWMQYALIFLVVEKIVQHIVVTLAFAYDWQEIRATVVVNPNILMALGVPIALGFALALWGIVRAQPWATNLVIGLALVDIVGEFVAQGKVAILITVSFLVAVILLMLALFYRRQIKNEQTLEGR